MNNNINNTLFENCKDYYHHYDCNATEIKEFYESSMSEKSNKAIYLIKNILTINRKQETYKYLEQLNNIENAIIPLKFQRDHVIHTLNCFLLGIYINEYFFSQNTISKVNIFQWKLASLFHDIGYQLQIADRLISNFKKNIAEVNIKLDINFNLDKIFSILIDNNLITLNNNINSLDLIQTTLNNWGLIIKVKKEFNKMKQNGYICHGIISSLLLLKTLDELYHKYNHERLNNQTDWNQRFFDEDIVSACSAIFTHNLKEESFKNSKINPNKMNLLFLLKLSDILQEWERPKNNLDNGNPPDLFEIDIKQDKIYFRTKVEGLIDILKNQTSPYFDENYIEIVPI